VAQQLPARAVASWNDRVDLRISVSAISLGSVIAFGELTASLRIRADFYEMTAQVLPIVMLAVVVEGRFFRGLERRETTGRVVLKTFLFLPILGEAAALVCVAQGHASPLERGTVFTAYVVMLALLCVYAVDGPARSVPTRASILNDAVLQVRTASETQARGRVNDDGAATSGQSSRYFC
jgi:peptidoglycan/LPS O-acetylase OafA/YrhL